MKVHGLIGGFVLEGTPAECREFLLEEAKAIDAAMAKARDAMDSLVNDIVRGAKAVDKAVDKYEGRGAPFDEPLPAAAVTPLERPSKALEQDPPHPDDVDEPIPDPDDDYAAYDNDIPF